MKIKKIVITGGPCGGKSTAMSWIQNYFTEAGYTVLFVPETATELISGGVAPWTCGTNAEYQKCQMSLQLAKERIFEQAAKTMNAERLLLVCDRGALDNKAYMNDDEFAEVLAFLGANEIELRDGYDAIFHLMTSAKGAKEYYSSETNAIRYESAEKAVEVDDRLIAAWTGHPHLRIIDNERNFEDKMKTLIAEISSFLGEPEPFEIERKFLIEYPDVKWLESLPNCRRIEIVQTYLHSEPGDEIRIRQRGANGHYVYFLTKKKLVNKYKRVETESRLTEKEYLELLGEADVSKRQIRKERYCLSFDKQYFEIDVYPFWNDKATIEIELRDENAEIRFPDGIKVIREVTGEKEFKNSYLAMNY